MSKPWREEIEEWMHRQAERERDKVAERARKSMDPAWSEPEKREIEPVEDDPPHDYASETQEGG